MKVQGNQRIARAFDLTDQTHDFLAVHQKLAGARHLGLFVRADLIGGGEVGVTEKEFPFPRIDVRKIDGGASGTHTFDFPASEDEPRLKALFNEIVKGGAFVLNYSGQFVLYPSESKIFFVRAF